jgi:hypothetical protein
MNSAIRDAEDMMDVTSEKDVRCPGRITKSASNKGKVNYPDSINFWWLWVPVKKLWRQPNCRTSSTTSTQKGGWDDCGLSVFMVVCMLR